MEIDLDRWRNLLAALADANDAAPSITLVTRTQARWAAARNTLGDFQAQGARGHRDQRNPDLAKAFDASVAELQAAVEEADRELARVNRLVSATSERRRQAHQLIEGVKEWARANNVTLLDGSGVRLQGFGATVHIEQPPGPAREFIPGV